VVLIKPPNKLTLSPKGVLVTEPILSNSKKDKLNTSPLFCMQDKTRIKFMVSYLS
jgi:hypothetical protein